MPPQIIGIELFCATILNEADGLEDVPVGAIQPPHENSTVKASTGSDVEQALDDTIEQGAMSTQPIATEPRVEKLSEPQFNQANAAPITGPNDGEDVSVGAIQPIHESPTVSDDQQARVDMIEQGAMSAQIIAQPTIEKLGDANLNEADDVAFVGPNDAEDVPVGAIEPSNENNNPLKADNTVAFIEDQVTQYEE